MLFLPFKRLYEHRSSYASEFGQVAKHYVETVLEYSKDIFIGNGRQGPFDHLLRLKNGTHNSHRQGTFNPSNLFLYAVTDSQMNRKWGRPMVDAIEAAIEGGATIVQLRFDCLMLDFFPLFKIELTGRKLKWFS